MDTGSLIWLGIFFISAALFFYTAIIISIVGSKDLKDLLSKSRKLK